MKRITYFGFFLFIAVVLYGCNDINYSLPSLRTTRNTEGTCIVHLDLRTGIQNAARTFFVKGSNPDKSNLSKIKIDIDWAHDSWDNDTNKPTLLVCVYDKGSLSNHLIQKIGKEGYQYYKGRGQQPPQLHINTDIRYLSGVATENQEIRLYLFDKSHTYTEGSTSLSINDGSDNLLQPLDDKDHVAFYDFTYTSKALKLSSIIGSPTHYDIGVLHPVGSLLLFNMVNSTGEEVDYPDKISIKTNMFSERFNINLLTGLSATQPNALATFTYNIDYSNKNKIENGGHSYIYGIPVLLSDENSSESGNLSITPSGSFDGKPFGTKTISVSDFIQKIDGKMVSFSVPLQSKTYNDADYMVTKWDDGLGGSLTIPMIIKDKQPPVFEYRQNTDEGGDGQWHKVEFTKSAIPRPINKKRYDNVRISGLPNTGKFELRFTNVYSFIVKDYTAQQNLLEVEQWGTTPFETMVYMFQNCKNMNVTATDIPDLSNCSYLAAMFDGCSSLVGNDSFKYWNPSAANDISFMFKGATKFNQDLSNWDVENVTDMRDMFENASSFNSDISNWNVGKVKYMQNMFANASNFDGDISKWNVGNVTEMQHMFENASNFNADISKWDVENVTDMKHMFDNASNFNADISKWDVENVTDMSYMFQYASNFNADISKWNVGKVTNMTSMFSNTNLFNGDLSKWNVGNVQSMGFMFYNAVSFDGNLSNWNVDNVTIMSNMFGHAEKFRGTGLNTWAMHLGNVTDMQSMFQDASKFNADISKWKVDNVENMSYMFQHASKFNADISKWKVDNVSKWDAIFDGATTLPEAHKPERFK